MQKDTVVPLRQPEGRDLLSTMLREGAQRLIAEALRAEFDAFLSQFAARRGEHGRAAVVRNFDGGGLPWLYLHGLSTGDMREALTVRWVPRRRVCRRRRTARLKQRWSRESEAWRRKPLSKGALGALYGPTTSTRGCALRDERLCALVVIEVKQKYQSNSVAASARVHQIRQ
jgi:hypothetical protein